VERFDGTLIAQKALSAVARLKERFGAGYVIEFLRGSKSEKIREEHKQLKTYGIGADISKADWQRYVRELVATGYLQTSEGEYPVLQLTEKSEAVLKGVEKVQFIASQITEEREDDIELPFEMDLLNELKTVRRDIAQNENVPPYIILADNTLVEMATYFPQSLDELRLVSGFGDIKLARYGREFLAAVKSYSAQRGLSSKMGQKKAKRERKPSANRTARKVAGTQRESFKLYKEGKTITEIAAERGLAPTTIEGHLAYFIEQRELDVTDIVQPEKIPPIQDVIEKYGDDKLAPLKEVLGEHYSYGEIRSVISWMKAGKPEYRV
jgi:ATP-dependent DNA helicase RecQ